MSHQNAFADLKKSEKGSEIAYENFESFCIEFVFQITNKPDRGNDFYILKHNINLELRLENCNEILMERLGMFGNKCEIENLFYLRNCFIRCCKESILQFISLQDFDERIFKEVYEIIFRYTITYLLEPSIFNAQFVDQRLFEFIQQSFTDNKTNLFLGELRERMSQEELFEIFNQAIFVMIGKLRNPALCVTDPEYTQASDMLEFLTSDEKISQSEAFMPYPNLDSLPAKLLSNFTYFGLMFNAVCSSSTDQGMGFFNLHALSPEDNRAVTASIRNTLASIFDKMIFCLKRLIAQPTFKESIYIWFYRCITSNIGRSRLGHELMLNEGSNIPNGFFANLTYVVLKIFSPIGKDYTKLISRIDPEYCFDDHVFIDFLERTYTFSYNSESFLNSESDDINVLSPKKKVFNFPSHWFYICHHVIKVGYHPALDFLVKLSRHIAQTSQSLSDETPADRSIIKRQLEPLIEEEMCLMSQIMNPSLIELLIEFANSTCVMLLFLCGVDFRYVDSFDVDKFTPIYKYFSRTPSFILEQTATLLQLLIICDSTQCTYLRENLYPIVFSFVLFMGDKRLVSNPHIRAKLVESLYHSALPEYLFPESNSKHSNFDFASYSPLIKLLPRSLIKLFIDIEFTGDSNEFQDKFWYRYYMYKMLFHIWKFDSYVDEFKTLALGAVQSINDDLHIYMRFINLLINDATYLLDEALSYLKKIRELEVEMESPDFNSLSSNDRAEKTAFLDQYYKLSVGYNTMSYDTIYALQLLTRDTPEPFISFMMIDRISAMLNYFLLYLVGKKKTDLKIKNLSRVKFEPKKLLVMICHIYTRLSEYESFVVAAAEDTRSFTLELPDMALKVLQLINADYSLIAAFERLKKQLDQVYHSNKLKEIDLDIVPEEFLDPISCSIMLDPVMLPSTKTIIDRTTITKHLLSSETDPFNRSALSVNMLIELPELKSQIMEWLSNYKNSS